MKLDVTEILNKRKKSLDFFFELLPDGSEGYALLPDGERFASPARIGCRAEDINGYIRLTFDVSADITCVCNRCLDEFVYGLDFSFERFAGQSPTQLYGEDTDDTEEDVLDIRDSCVFPDADIMEEISLAAPEYPLCSEDCPGLCQRCGKKIGECACPNEPEEKPRDPRNDVFRELLRRMEDEENAPDGGSDGAD